ncbi:hypothetical protein AS156_15385 [Bradyrhizobium macuxiense]|uniref:Uncharacterized protein n=1 Tax=Bradyrhizobium macuxiense TaxID=1755647 RepID=A0A109JJ41_9BRAD|nr:hypothetical protein [Bradyrhizobium macuxiense]KWV49980.1 hypothetical protein AS156_15385 [Bradyrhizobium macuxiense]
MLTADRFDSRTFANMEVALERACEHLPKGTDDYNARRYIARRIIKCAEGGDRTLGGLTEAGQAAVSELTSNKAA